MQDQVTKFTSRGMTAEFVSVQCSPAIAGRIAEGKVQLVYMSPETVLSCPAWREIFRNINFQENLVCLAVDKAHLIEKWFVYICACVFPTYILFLYFCRGRQFRMDFAHIGEIHSLLPAGTSVMALTATANLTTRRMIIKNLEMHGCYIKSRNPNRANIHYVISEKPDVMEVFKPIVCDVCEKGEGANRCIIFCRTYNDCSMIF